jgi:uncharacterized protein YjbI with pentapeptide repeats
MVNQSAADRKSDVLKNILMNRREEENTHHHKKFDNITWEEKTISGRYFDHCTFCKCSLKGSVFEDCNFEKCVFEECDLSLIKLKDTTVSSAQINGSKAIGIVWHAASNPLSVNFKDSRIVTAVFTAKI